MKKVTLRRSAVRHLNPKNRHSAVRFKRAHCLSLEPKTLSISYSLRFIGVMLPCLGSDSAVFYYYTNEPLSGKLDSNQRP